MVDEATLVREEPTELCSFLKGPRVRTVVRLKTVDYLTFVDIRDWLEESEAWGRGYWISADRDKLLMLAGALIEAAECLDEAKPLI